MKTLPIEISKHGTFYRQVLRGSQTLLYAQFTDDQSSKPIGHEVFKLRVNKGGSRSFNGVDTTIEEAEAFPGNEAFGDWAFSYRTLEAATRHFEYLEGKADEPGLKAKAKAFLNEMGGSIPQLARLAFVTPSQLETWLEGESKSYDLFSRVSTFLQSKGAIA